ncbi:hypothetical protein I6A60_35990 [Frankia sp. AgB1.9]|nr:MULTISPECIES: hypothetical protein [unclassified Frankia]MBL7487779.1 hypothetical protein [Frankia sp. AgW1.1]MBL7553216.1 hypothetical protein [Frankia sp. AgB1.9]MBL7622939.1 hypothetical protein [Frankia sp. AgB1.8]
MRLFGSNFVANVATRDGRHHLVVAALLCMLELVLLVSVEVLFVHVLMAVALFARDAIDALPRRDRPTHDE